MKNYKKASKWFHFPFNFIMFIASIVVFIISIIDYKTWIFSCTFQLLSISCLISCYKEIKIKKSEWFSIKERNPHAHQPKNSKYPYYENFIIFTVIYNNFAHFFVLGIFLNISLMAMGRIPIKKRHSYECLFKLILQAKICSWDRTDSVIIIVFYWSCEFLVFIIFDMTTYKYRR